MRWALASILFGAAPFLFGLPVAVAVFGMAMGFNAILKEAEREDTRMGVQIVGWIGVLVGAAPVGLYFLTR